MPELKEPPYIEEVQLDEEPLPKPLAVLKDDYALSQVVQTFYHYERERQTHDRRWSLNDMLYVKWVPERFWPGTKIPRSNLGSSIVFQQVEGAMPMISQALFTSPEYFSIEADFGSDPKAARAQQAHLEYGFDTTAMNRGMTQEMEYKLAIKDLLIYGNGVVKTTYDPVTRLPSIERVDIRDLYFDPACPGPSIDQSRVVIERKMLTIRELQTYRNDPRMNVPSDDELWALAVNYQYVYADNNKRIQEAYRANSYQPGQSNILPAPSARQIEVLMYYDHFDIIWILGRKVVMYNDRNVYGDIPFSMGPCYTYPGRAYALSIADVQGDNQRYIEGLINGRLDAVNLAMFPPRFVPRGGIMNPNQQQWGPGSTFQVDNPQDVFVPKIEDVTSGIYQEINWIESSADKCTGLGSMALGIPQPSNANRTAGGVNAQLQGAALRLHTIVENIENFLIIPSIAKAIKMVRLHSGLDEQLPGRARSEQNPEEAQYVKVSAQAFGANSRVVVRGASKMLSRDRLSQLYQFVAQNTLSGQNVSALAQLGQTVDIGEMMTMLMDATGVSKRYQLIRPMTPEEKKAQQDAQAAQQAPQHNIDMQKAQLEAQTRLQMGQMAAQSKSEEHKTDYAIAQMKAQQGGPSSIDLQMQQQEAQAKTQQMTQQAETDRQKAQMDMMTKAKELEFKQAESQLKLAAQQASSQQKVQSDAASAQLKQQQMLMDMHHNAQSQQMERQHMAQTQQITNEGQKQGLNFQKQQAQMKLKQQIESQRQKDRDSRGKSKA